MVNSVNVPKDHYGVDWYNKPVNERSEYLNRWRTDNTVVLETEAFRLRCFRDGDGDAVLIDPPCSGHDSKLADWDKDQSLVACALENTVLPVYVIDYKGYTPEQGTETYDDIVNQVIECINFTATKRVHLISLCQSGPVGSIIAATNPHLISSLVVAGAPMNPQASESVLSNAINVPMWQYEMLVTMFGGYMTGKHMLECWMSSNMELHLYKRFQKETMEDYRSQRFAAWYYDSTQNIGGDWYLTAIKSIFKNNDLYNGNFMFNGQTVKLENIQCHVTSVYGEKDDISPKPHAVALGDKVESHEVYSTSGGHIGVFMGRSSIKNTWTKIFKKLK